MRNLVMDADAMFPEGFHPTQLMYKRDYSGLADYIPRSTAGVKYYFVEFGISAHITGDDGRFFVGNFGRDREPPELSATVPYDPFKLDIFIIGNMLRQNFYEVMIPRLLVSVMLIVVTEILQRRFFTTTHPVDDRYGS